MIAYDLFIFVDGLAFTIMLFGWPNHISSLFGGRAMRPAFWAANIIATTYMVYRYIY